MWNSRGFRRFMSVVVVVVGFNSLNLNALFIKDTVEVEYNTGDKENLYLCENQHGNSKL